MVAYVHIEYSTYQISEESKGGGGGNPPPPPGPCGTEKSVVLRGLNVTDVTENGVHMNSDIGNLICLSLLIRLTAVANLSFFGLKYEKTDILFFLYKYNFA